MIYFLKYNNNKLLGEFLNEPEFGLFYYTELLKQPVITEEEINLDLSDELLESNLEASLSFIVKTVKIDDKYVHLLFSKNDNLDINYLTFEEIYNGLSDIYKLDDILNILGKLFKLPNGNYVCDNVQSYITAIEEMSNNYNGEHFFRGHYSYKYMLVPSLYRKKRYYDNESFMYMDFKTEFYKELSGKKYIEILTTMQHYKMPTRLLDTTSNPLVALYMAIDKPTNYKREDLGIGEVIFMSEDKKNIKYSDSNAVTILSSLAVLETHFKQELYEKIIESKEKNDPSIYKNSMAYKRFVAEVSTELKGFDETFFNPDVLLKHRHVKVGMINERIVAQSGNFILFGLCNYETGDYLPLNTVSKERIFVVNKQYIMKQLELLNIDSGSMYPDKDHMSSEIIKKYD